MNVLIVERRRRLAELWRRALERLGVHLDIASSQDQAAETYHIVVLDLLLDEGSAFAVADIVSYRQSDDQVIFVINTSFFCDGSIFRFFLMMAPMFKAKRCLTIWPQLSNITSPTVIMTRDREGHHNLALD
jgi:hypothetical protein